MLGRLAHYSVRTANLEASEAFYTRVLGMEVGPRPPFGFPGRWLYYSHDRARDTQGCVHLIGAGGGDALGSYLGKRVDGPSSTTGALDHIAFFASDWPQCRDRLNAFHIPFSERFVPTLSVRQVFLADPDGVMIELNYPEVAGSP